MRRVAFFVAGLVLAGFPLCFVPDVGMAGERTHISVPAGSLVSVDSLSGLTLETSVRRLSRVIEWGDTARDLDGWCWTVGLGYSPWPFLRFGAFAGTAAAEVDEREGSYGFLWGVHSSIAMLEYVLDESPVFGRVKAIRFMTDLEYRRARPDIDRDDILIEETTIAPHVVYALNLRGPRRWHPYTLLGVAVRGGVVFSVVDAEIDDQSFEESNRMGLLLGVDMQFNDEVALRLTSHLYSEDDLTIGASVGYYF